MLYEVITRSQIPDSGGKEMGGRGAADISSSKQKVPWNRITSYNVCYTKLLRKGPKPRDPDIS